VDENGPPSASLPLAQGAVQRMAAQAYFPIRQNKLCRCNKKPDFTRKSGFLLVLVLDERSPVL